LVQLRGFPALTCARKAQPMDRPAEVEIKYLVRDPALSGRLEHASEIGAFRVVSRKRVEQTDEYWDTPEFAAAANKISVRRRLAKGEARYTVKVGAVSGGFSRRVEIEEPAGDVGLIDWLQRLIAERRVEVPFSLAHLAPRVCVRNRRTALELFHPNGAEVELALDRVTFEGPRGEASEREIEGELVAGDESVLLELRDWLTAQGGVRESQASKYERALELVG
jgi:triphosphatase